MEEEEEEQPYQNTLLDQRDNGIRGKAVASWPGPRLFQLFLFLHACVASFPVPPSSRRKGSRLFFLVRCLSLDTGQSHASISTRTAANPPWRGNICRAMHHALHGQRTAPCIDHMRCYLHRQMHGPGTCLVVCPGLLSVLHYTVLFSIHMVTLIQKLIKMIMEYTRNCRKVKSMHEDPIVTAIFTWLGQRKVSRNVHLFGCQDNELSLTCTCKRAPEK